MLDIFGRLKNLDMAQTHCLTIQDIMNIQTSKYISRFHVSVEQFLGVTPQPKHSQQQFNRPPLFLPSFFGSGSEGKHLTHREGIEPSKRFRGTPGSRWGWIFDSEALLIREVFQGVSLQPGNSGWLVVPLVGWRIIPGLGYVVRITSIF